MGKMHRRLLPAILLLILLSGKVAAQQPIRVGLYFENGTNARLLSAEMTNPGGLAASLRLAAGPVQLPLHYTQVLLSPGKQAYVQMGAFADFDSALALALEARARSLQAYVAYRIDQTQLPFKVWVDDPELVVKSLFPNIAGIFTTSTQGDFLVLADRLQSQVGLITDGRIRLRLEPLDGTLTRVAASGQFTRNYEGAFELSMSGGRLAVVNIPGLEQYVFGVVPYEMYPDWPLEALKAQAVAARSYALANLNKHQSLGFDLCDSPACCQKYAGFGSGDSFQNAKRAVQETAGRVARYNGSVARLFYHSNSGGYTENAQDVWSGSVPYIRAVPDPYSVSTSLIVHLVARSSNPTEFPARWLRSFTRAEIETLLRENTGRDVGTILEIRSLERSAGGRHLALLVSGTRGEARIERSNTRFAFNLPSSLYEIISIHQTVRAAGAGGQLYEIPVSNMLHVATAAGPRLAAPGSTEIYLSNGSRSKAVSRLPIGFSFDGRGFGHGVGMSQWGAFEMARLGYNYEEILKYYFHGITID